MPVITQAIDSGDGVFIGRKHLHHIFKPMNNTELTLDQLQTIAGGGVFAKLDGFKTNLERKASPSMEDVVLGPLGGEGVFLGPICGEGVFKTQSVDMKGSVIVGDNHF